MEKAEPSGAKTRSKGTGAPADLAAYIAAMAPRKVGAVEVSITGLLPGLMMARADPRVISRAEGGAGESKVRKGTPTPEQQAEALAYRMADGSLCLPQSGGVSAVYRAMLQASKGYSVRLEGQGRPASILPFIASGVKVWPTEGISLGTKDYEVSELTAVNWNKGKQTRIAVYRPWLRNWSAHLWLSYDGEVFPDGPFIGSGGRTVHLRAVLGTAGIKVGIGAFRPGAPSPGPYGTFYVSGWNEE